MSALDTLRQFLPWSKSQTQAAADAQALADESRRLDAVAGVLFQTGLGAMLGGLAIAAAGTGVPELERAGLVLASFLIGSTGLLSGLTLLRVQPDTSLDGHEVETRRRELNNYLFSFILVVLVTATLKIVIVAVP